MSALKQRNRSNTAINLEKLDKTSDDKKISGTEQTPKRKLPLRVLSRIVVITSLLIIVYFSTKDEKIKPLAKQSELLTGKGQIVECSPGYMKELNKYEGCFPRDCGRFISDKIVNPNEVSELLNIVKKGLKFGGSSGGASILDLHTGALSKGQKFINIYKLKETKDLFTEDEFTIFRVVKDKIKFAISHHFGVDPNKIYLTYPTFFSEITSKKAVTIHDEYWHPHVDKETYKSFHYTTLLYLSDYNIDFKGGRFVFVDEKFNRTLEPRKGRVSMFTSGAENLHYVEKVKSGVRNAVTISFTCDKEYAINDPNLNKYDTQ